MAVCQAAASGLLQINLLISRATQLSASYSARICLGHYNCASRRCSSCSFNTQHIPQPKHQLVIISKFSTSRKIQFSVFFKFIRTMDSNHSSEIEDAIEETDAVLNEIQKRQRDSIDSSGESPPSKKPQQEESLSESLNLKHLQDDRISIGGVNYESVSAGLLKNNDRHRECGSSELDHKLFENTVQKDEENTFKQSLSHESTVDSGSFVSPHKDFSDKDVDGSYQEKPIKGPSKTFGSNMSLSMSVSQDSLDQDASLTESIDQDISLAESGNISSGVFETECESLTTSEVFPDGNLGKSGESSKVTDSNKPISEITESVPPAKKSKHKQSKEEKKKKKGKKRTKKLGGTAVCEDGENVNLRPNYFLGIQITNPDIHKAIVKVQEDMLAFDESLTRSFVDAATSHLTLLVAYIDTEESLQVAQSAMDECASRLMGDLTTNPLKLTFSGVSHFSNHVVFANIVEDEQYQRLMEVAESARTVFSEKGVCMPDTRVLHPHLTIAKLSKAPKIRGKRTPRKIDPSGYKQHLELNFGYQIVSGLQLLAMNKPKDEKRYYYSSKDITFNVKYEESTDHSHCCFPRRPLLQKQNVKQERSLSTSSESLPDSSPDWLLPTIGVMTALAVIVTFGLFVVRFQNKP
ncbi:uro-adherence factor A [Procambarus clarkii]|uniref:uro-adherence factor A n=1 Tax=Procambarus clarkii TaxID=6728 RepID=UPI003742E6C8